MRVVTPEEVKSVLLFSDLIPALSENFVAFSRGNAQVAPLSNIDFAELNGEIHIKSGWISGGPFVCTKLVTCYYDNPNIGLPTRDGALVVINRLNGRFEAFIYDAGHVTNMRTAGASAVAVQTLARKDADELGIIGTGTQAYWHAAAIASVTKLRSVKVAGRNKERADELCRKIEQRLEVPASTVDTQSAAEAPIVVTATPAREPVLTSERLNPGTLLVAMGSDAIGKKELGSAIVEQANLLVADSEKQCVEIGEMQWRTEWKRAPRVQQLGEIVSGADIGRQSNDDIVIFDSTGLGFQDLVGAECVLRNLRNAA
ncbi:MAG TPA: ornithine cyclodeaminase family protein [Xanthobacteraceae bacterium]|nr:ornithine cyclodeaminase family protein [Xanthobacteraceae bacterium]